MLAVMVLSSIAAAPAFAKYSTSTVSFKQLTAGKCLTFKDSPFSKGFMDGRYSKYMFGPFQNFCFTPDGKNVFANSIANDGKSLSTGLICYRHEGKIGQFRDGTVLQGYGHSDVLAISQPDLSKETYHVWLAKSKAKNAKNKEDTYGKIIERMTVSFKNGSDKMKVSDKIEITNYQYAQVNVKKGKRVSAKMPYGAPARLSAAVNQTDNRIAFRICFETGWGTNYVIYDLEKFDDAVDKAVKAGKKTYDIRQARDFQISNLRDNAVPLDGFQSMDVDKNYLYIVGFTAKKTKYNGGVYKIRYKNSIEELDEMGTLKGVVQQIKIELKSEIEGIKIAKAGKKMAYYLNAIPHKPGQLRWGQLIYKVER